VSIDANILAAGIERGESAAVDAALAGRAPLVSQTAAKEFRRGPGATQAQIDSFLQARGGRVVPDASSTTIANVEARLVRHNAGVHPNQHRRFRGKDLCVAATACETGTSLLTEDTRLRNTMNALGLPVEAY
jgi:predicted nucleic acid-binding protein